MSSLSQRLARLRKSGTPPKVIKDSSVPDRSPPGTGWTKKAEFFWERELYYPACLPERFEANLVIPESIRPEELVFYDLETTGLSGGAGNTAFLIGLGWQRDATFRVLQLFLADYPGEEALLQRYLELAGTVAPQVSYNGRSFDSQVLKTRFLLNRMAPSGAPQVDLLYPSRRLWKPVLENLTLRSIEQNVLDFYRVDDLPGSEAPDAWFEWLKGDAGRIEGVFQHNADDIVSLGRLAGRLEEWGNIDPPIEADTPVPEGAPVSHWGMAVQWSGRDSRKETDWLEAGYAAGDRRCGMELALRRRREGLHDEARIIWESFNHRGLDYTSALELAKYWEHREKDPRRALDITEPLCGLPLSEKHRRELEHRRKRLNRKIQKFSGN